MQKSFDASDFQSLFSIISPLYYKVCADLRNFFQKSEKMYKFPHKVKNIRVKIKINPLCRVFCEGIYEK